MVRKLALAVSIALGAVNAPVHALGLGELDSESALNQNFNGAITLLSVAPEELDMIRVRLADADAFKRAGIERPFYLSLLKFEPAVSATGKTVIQVTSGFPIREPFLNFLVEVNWPNGRVLREYTVLLDPPTTTRRRPPQVVPASRSPAPASPVSAKVPARAAPRTAGTSQQPLTQPTAGEYGPVRANETAWSIAKRVRPQGVSMAQMMMALLDANPAAFVGGNINRLRRGQILRVPQLDEIQAISRQQARAAYRDQQDAWLARRGEKVQQAATTDAAPEAPVPQDDATAQDELRIATPRPEGEGEAGAADSAVDTTTTQSLKTRLIVARENAETSRQESETLRSQVDDLQARLQDMQKLLSLKDDQLSQLQDRVLAGSVAPEPVAVAVEPAADEAAEAAPPEAPDASFAGMPESDVIVVEDEPETADVVMANQVEPSPGVAAADLRDDIPAPQTDPNRVVMSAEQSAGETLGMPEQIDPDEIVRASVRADQGADAETAGSATVDTVPAAGEVVVTDEAAGPSALDPGSVPQRPVDASAVVAEVVPADQPVASPVDGGPSRQQMLATLEEYIVPLGIGSVLLLGLIGFVATRGRSETEATGKLAVVPAAAGAADEAVAETRQAHVEPAESAPQPAVHPTGELPADVEAAIADLGNESSLLTDISPSDIDSLQDETGEVDPVSEADVYIAYGRYQQAQELLSQALEREPDRLALKHKLLEVYYATRNGGEFSRLAQQMVDAGQDTVDEMAWVRAQDMGRELAPDHPLFQLRAVGGDASLAALGATASKVDDDTLGLDELEMSELNSAYAEQLSGQADLEAPSEVSVLLEPHTGSVAGQDDDTLGDSITLDELESLELEAATVVESNVSRTDSEEQLDTASFDLDSIVTEDSSESGMGDSVAGLDSEFTAEELQAQLDELSDLSVLDPNLAGSQYGDAAEPPGGLGLVEEDGLPEQIGLDEPLDLTEAFDKSVGESADEEILDLDTQVDAGTELTDDAITTKLDLARAYVEMGDSEGARSILDEVVNEGSAQQRAEAEKLRSGLV